MLIRKFLAGLLVSLLAFAPVDGATPAQRVVVLSGVQSWSLPGSSADLYFAQNAGSCAINRLAKPCASLLSTTRASTGDAQWADGHYSSFGNNVPRITDQGLLAEQASTNTALWCRDMTNAAWVKVTMTAALTATGIDNTANAASTLTATGGNATILQTLTIASSAENYSVFLKRVSGTGTINITENGGTSWTAVTLTTAWQRFSVEATLANPVIGIQIVTSGDVIAADFNQTEALAFPTSPILTTTGSATRAADVIALTGAAQTAALAAKAAYFQIGSAAIGNTNSRLVTFNGNATMFLNGSGTPVTVQNSSGSGPAAALGSGTIAGSVKSAFGFDGSGLSAIGNGGTKATTADAWTGNTGTVTLGNRSAGDRALNGYMRRLAFGLTKGQFDALTN